VIAATHGAGVLRLDSRRSGEAWRPVEVRCGLPLRDAGRFHPVRSVAVDPQGRKVLVGTVEGVFRSENGGETFAEVSRREFMERVTLPETWLFCSGEHRIEVVTEDEARGD
jgi:hypothetical protein